MKRSNLFVALASLTLTVVGLLSFRPAKKFSPPICVYAGGYGYLFGGTPQIPWTNVPGHTALFKTCYGPLVTLRTSSSWFPGNAYVR